MVKGVESQTKLLMYLYNLSNLYLKEIAKNHDYRNFNTIIDGTYQRLDKTTIDELCKFLGVSYGVVLNNIKKNPSIDEDEGRVYITNWNAWIDFGDYIYLRSKDLIVDMLSRDSMCIKHYINLKKLNPESESYKSLIALLNEYFKSMLNIDEAMNADERSTTYENYKGTKLKLLKIAKELPLVRPKFLKATGGRGRITYLQTMENYVKLIKPYITRYEDGVDVNSIVDLN